MLTMKKGSEQQKAQKQEMKDGITA